MYWNIRWLFEFADVHFAQYHLELINENRDLEVNVKTIHLQTSSQSASAILIVVQQISE